MRQYPGTTYCSVPASTKATLPNDYDSTWGTPFGVHIHVHMDVLLILVTKGDPSKEVPCVPPYCTPKASGEGVALACCGGWAGKGPEYLQSCSGIPPPQDPPQFYPQSC